jgi:hypothetical protein
MLIGSRVRREGDPKKLRQIRNGAPTSAMFVFVNNALEQDCKIPLSHDPPRDRATLCLSIS